MKMSAFALTALLTASLQQAATPAFGQSSGTTIVAPSVTRMAPVQQQTNDGDNALNVGDYPRAERYFASQLQGLSKGSDREGYLRMGYGEALLWEDKVSEAAAQFKKARNLISGKGSSDGGQLQVRIADDLSWLAQSQGKPAMSVQYAEESVQAAKSGKDVPPLMLVTALTHLAYLQDETDLLEKAAVTYSEALDAETKYNGPQSLVGADIREQLGGVLRRLGRGAEATRQFQDSLIVKFGANAPTSSYEPHPYWNDVIFRFQIGAPNCLRKNEGGQDLQIITANGVTIAAAMSMDGTGLVKSGRIDLSVKNDSNSLIQLLPKPPIFYTLLPKVMLARQLNASELANKVEKKGEKKAKWIRFMGADATQTMTTTMIGNGGMYGFPPMYSYGGAYPIVNRSRGSNMTTVMTQVPDYVAQERALAKAADVADKARSTAESIRTNAISATSISPGQSISGALFFDVEKVQRASLQVPVGNALFEFTFPPR